MSERPDLEGISKKLNKGVWDGDDLWEMLDYALVLDRELAELRQEYTDYQEHTARSHRLMVDEVDDLEQKLAAARARAERLAGWAKERGHYPHCPNFQYRPGARPCDPRTCGLFDALERGGGEG